MRRRSILPILAVTALTVPVGVLFSAGTQSTEEPPPPPAWVDHEFQLFKVLSEEESQRAPEDQQKLMSLGEDGITLFIDRGSEDGAKKYYEDIVGKLEKFPVSGEAFLKSDLPQMLKYFGYDPLLPEDLQKLHPDVIMDDAKLRKSVSNPDAFKGFDPLKPGEILVSRFFAPKIASVKDLPAKEFGWRKLVRFKAREKSPAQGDQLAAFYLLFNFASAKPEFPEGVPAGQIQAIAIPVYPNGKQHFSAYYFVYNALSGKCPKADQNGNVVIEDCKPGQLGLHLTASFDANGLPQRNYFVPIACAQCHGSSGLGKDGSKVNYLDTDHWYDRVNPQDGDFKQVPSENVLVQGGGRAMKVIYDLNKEIKAQNEAVGTGSFQAKATVKWLDLHKDCDGAKDECKNEHFEPIRRGLPGNKPGDPVWSPDNANDKQLLPALNQACFRCHSSFSYHVFDKTAVLDKIKTRFLIERVSGKSMPPDRQLSDQARTELVDRLKKLKAENP